MAATVTISETNGPSGSTTETADVANVNFGSTDAAALTPSSAPITAQADGHSFEKWLRMYVQDLGGSSQIDNLKVWLSIVTYVTGEGMSCNLRESAYVQASYPAGGPVETDSAVADQAMPTTEPSGANLGISGSLSGQITAAPAYSDYAVLQLDVSELTPAGAVNQKVITFQWDEQ